MLTIEQAVALALENNQLVKNADLEVGKSDDRLAAARTRRLPAFSVQLLEAFLLTPLDFEFKQGAFGTFAATGPVPPEDTTIRTPAGAVTFLNASVSQPLSQLYRVGLHTELLTASREIAREQLRAQRQAVANEVRRTYYGLIQTRSAIEATEEAIKFHRELDRLVERYVEEQVALRSESLEVKARLAKAEHDVLALRNAWSSQQEQLNHLLGRDIATGFGIVPVPDVAPFEADLQAARALAVTQRPELKEARLKVAQAEYDARIKQSEYLPDLSLALNYLTHANVEVIPANVVAVGLVLSWDVFDWGRKARELAEKRKTVEQARNGLQHTEPRVLLELNTRFRKLQETRALVRVSQLSQDAARERVRVAMDKYGQQAVLLKDVLQTQASLAESNAQYQQTLSTFWTARADFERALGAE